MATSHTGGSGEGDGEKGEGDSGGGNDSSNKRLFGVQSSSAHSSAVSSVVSQVLAAVSQSQQPESEAGVDSVTRNQRRRSRNYRARSMGEETSGDEAEGDRQPNSELLGWSEYFFSSSSSMSSGSTSSVDNDNTTMAVEDDAPTPEVLLKPKPRHKWFIINEVVNRQKGVGCRYQGSELFQQRCYGSLHAVQRLELMYKLEEHKGCVNNLNFNQSGTLLSSASDDRQVALWDWACGKCLLTYDSGHTSNVFQAKFLPLSGDCHIVSCARDGQVRLAVLSSTGECKGTRQLAQHRRPTHKLATHPETPHVFLSAGEDALVLSHDVRLNKPNKLLFVREEEKGRKVGLYSIHSNPVNSNEFCVTGEDHYIRLYDRRKTSDSPLKKFCPQHLVKSDVFLHVTCAVFNYNGTEILGSFNDDDIYLFDTRQPDGADYVHRYSGHRNSVTVKGVNFFGLRSEYIVSGSDCGNIYFWDKNSEAIVQWMRGDEDGVVNCLEPHPQVPVLATSGLDSDIKIWVPSCEVEPTLNGLKKVVITNQRRRDECHGRRSDPFDGQMRWLWRQIQRFERRRGVVSRAQSGSGSETQNPRSQSEPERNVSSSSSEDEAMDPCRPQCSPS